MLNFPRLFLKSDPSSSTNIDPLYQLKFPPQIYLTGKISKSMIFLVCSQETYVYESIRSLTMAMQSTV